MSGVDSLPGGGRKFSANAFNSKFKYLAKQGGDIAKLSDNQEAIMKAVQNYQTSIRRGTFNKAQQNSMLRRIKTAGDLNSTSLKTLNKMTDRLAGGGEVKKLKPKIRIITSDDGEIVMPGFANQQQMKGSGLSDVSSPKTRQSATNRNISNSINQVTSGERDRKLSPPRASASRPPSIPLFR